MGQSAFCGCSDSNKTRMEKLRVKHEKRMKYKAVKCDKIGTQETLDGEYGEQQKEAKTLNNNNDTDDVNDDGNNDLFDVPSLELSNKYHSTPSVLIKKKKKKTKHKKVNSVFIAKQKLSTLIQEEEIETYEEAVNKYTLKLSDTESDESSSLSSSSFGAHANHVYGEDDEFEDDEESSSIKYSESATTIHRKNTIESVISTLTN